MVQQLATASVLVIVVVLVGCGGDGAGGLDSGSASDARSVATDAGGGGWSAGPALIGGPVQETAAVAVDGKVYVIGGFNAQIGVVDTVRVYDISADSWSAGPALPRAVHHANAVVVDDRIYVLGYLEGTGFSAAGDVWSWKPATEASWSVRTSMPTGTERGSSVVGVIDGAVYLAGGFRGGAAVADVSVYRPGEDAWDTTPADLPQPRDHACGGVLGGKLYVAGGRQGAIASISAVLYELAPGGVWTEKAPMITGRGGTACGVVNGALIVVGGEGNPALPSGVFPQTESYSAVSDRWAALEPMPRPRHGMAAAVWGGKLYVPGGADTDGFDAVDTFEVYSP